MLNKNRIGYQMKKAMVLCLVVCLAILGFRKTDRMRFGVPDHWPKPKHNFSRYPLYASTVLLGKALFYDPVLSKDSTISCASCHSQFTAFAHVDHTLSHGIQGRIGTRNAPPLMNLAWHSEVMWDGRVPNIEEQATFPITHPDEMGEQLDNVAEKLQGSGIYRYLFYRSFGDSTVTKEKILLSISQFMLSIISADSRYDSMRRHETVFTQKEENGYRIFKLHCSSCHKEPLFTNLGYENNGIGVDTELKDIGRVKVTHNPEDSFKFKVPTLRNIEFSSPYMHDGRFKRLYDVLNHYTTGIKRSKTLAKQLENPIILTANEKVDLLAFLLTLTDKHFLFNPEYGYPKNIFTPKRMN
jgi:cytochrome c peroxidase